MGRRLEAFSELPGFDLVAKGVEDLAAGRQSVPALLVSQASSRLRTVGIELPYVDARDLDWRLYRAVEVEVGELAAHARYNALRRRLVSFLDAARDPTRPGVSPLTYFR